MVVTDAIELLGGHAGLHVGGDDLQDLGGQAAGDAHFLDVFGGFDLDSHAAIIAYFGICLNGAVAA
ncbi:hypothetical protein GCM10027191_15600 [Novilysobacter erysipheiresistens]